MAKKDQTGEIDSPRVATRGEDILSSVKDVRAEMDWCEAPGHPTDGFGVGVEPVLCLRVEGSSVCVYCVARALIDAVIGLQQNRPNLCLGIPRELEGADVDGESLFEPGTEEGAREELLVYLGTIFSAADKRRRAREEVALAINEAEAIARGLA